MSQDSWLAYAVVVLVGTLVGSLANVCIDRLPRHVSRRSPGSSGPGCQTALCPGQPIALLRALFWGGRWATGPTVLAPRSLLVALGNGVLYGLLYHHYHFSVQGVVFALFATALLIVAGIDLVHKLIFDAITLPGIVVGLVASTWLTPVGLGNAILGALLGGGLFLLLAVLSVVILHRDGMGGGDIKLIAMIGAFLGWPGVLVTIFLGAAGMAVVGLVLRLLRRLGPQELVPFGPFLALGALLAMVWGEPIFAWYVHRSL